VGKERKMDLKNRIQECARPYDDRKLLSLADSRTIATDFGIPPLFVEKCALQNGVIPSRYERNIGVLGFQGQIRLLDSSVAVIGCGGLGGTVSEILARAGVGELVLVDGDVFGENNLNRQLFSCESGLGKAKVEVAVERISEINGAVKVLPHNVMLDEKNLSIILHDVDMAVDALDNNSSRKILYHGCGEEGIPVVHGAVGGVAGQVSLYKPGNRTHLDLFGKEHMADRGVESTAGVPSYSPFIVASLQAAIVISEITGVSTGLDEKLFLLDMLSLHSDILDLHLNGDSSNS
jgi:molybdopterin/thiamine biosynthesis adenylyltransferase